MSVLALALVPLVLEAVVLGVCLGWWLKLPVFLAIAGALILAAVCPALTGTTMSEWQQARLSITKGIALRGLACAQAVLVANGVLEHLSIRQGQVALHQLHHRMLSKAFQSAF